MNTDNMTHTIDSIVKDEVSRINAVEVQGSLEEMIQLDMKLSSQDTREEYAQARGWVQENINGMEIVNL